VVGAGVEACALHPPCLAAVRNRLGCEVPGLRAGTAPLTGARAAPNGKGHQSGSQSMAPRRHPYNSVCSLRVLSLARTRRFVRPGAVFPHVQPLALPPREPSCAAHRTVYSHTPLLCFSRCVAGPLLLCVLGCQMLQDGSQGLDCVSWTRSQVTRCRMRRKERQGDRRLGCTWCRSSGGRTPYDVHKR
jgi:hypothetical protein